MHRRARDYRRAVDERLFGLGDVRYGALIDLLIKIRAPQLSKRPDERGLSDALTGALPPLDQALIADVAEAFRALEEDGEQLAAMVEARDASERYLTTYRAYARMATRRRAAPVRQAQTVFDRVSRELGEAEEQHARAQAELAQARETLDALRAERTRLDARRQALQDDPAARSARELHRAAEEAEQAPAARGGADRGRAPGRTASRELRDRVNGGRSRGGGRDIRARRHPARGGRPCRPRAHRRRGGGGDRTSRSRRDAPAHRDADRTPADGDRPRARRSCSDGNRRETRSRRRGRAPSSSSASTPG